MTIEKNQAKFNLQNVSVVEISFVKTPAVPDATFRVYKSAVPDGQAAIFKGMSIVAKDAVKKQVFGYVLVPNQADLQGDVVTKEEVEKARDTFMLNAINGLLKGAGAGAEHKLFEGIGNPVESAIDKDGSLAKSHGVAGVAGGWWMGFQCSDATWDAVEKGEFTGFSIGGFGVRTPVETEKSAAKKFFRPLQSMVEKIGQLAKGEGDAKTFNDMLTEQDIRSQLWEIFYTLEDSVFSIVSDGTVANKAQMVETTFDQAKSATMALVAILKTAEFAKSKNFAEMKSSFETMVEKIRTVINSADEGVVNKSQEGASAMAGNSETMTIEDLSKQVAGLVNVVGKISEKLNLKKDGEGEQPKPDEQKKPEEGGGAPAPEQKKPEDGKPAEGGEGGAPESTEKSMELLAKTIVKLTESVSEIVKRLQVVEKTPQPRIGEGDPNGSAAAPVVKNHAGTPFDFSH